MHPAVLELLVVVQDGVELGLLALDVARQLADLLLEARLLRSLVLDVGLLDRLRDLSKLFAYATFHHIIQKTLNEQSHNVLAV